MSWLARRLALLLLLVLTVGCGEGQEDPRTASVTGEVTFRGQPAPFVGLNFVDANHNAIGTTADDHGRYEIIALPPGPMTILAQTFPPVLPDPSIPQVPVIPQRYGYVDYSGLTCTIVSGLQVHNIELQEK